MKKNILIFFIVIIIFLGGYLYISNKTNYRSLENLNLDNNQQQDSIKETSLVSKSGCLKENEIADFVSNGFVIKEVKVSKNPAVITISDKVFNKEIHRFNIEGASDSGFTLWLMPCGVYINRQFNYDFGALEMKPDFRSELWKYDYQGNGKYLFTIYIPKDPKHNYGPSFAINPNEKYITMMRRNYSQSHSSQLIVVKDLNTFEDIYEFNSEEFFKVHPELTGDEPDIDDTINIEDFWSNDGKYFWVRTSEMEYVYAYVRIDPFNKNYKAFESPPYARGGDALNPNNGFVTYIENAVWTGETFANEEVQQEYKKENKFAYFYVYNLYTKEKVLLYKNQDPTFNYEPRWINEDTLQYKIPDGTLKQYKIQ